MAKTNKAVKAVAVVAKAEGKTWQGYTTCALLRALGYAGYTAKQAGALCTAVGLQVAPATLGCQVGGGRQYATGVAQPHHTGAFTPLSGAVLAQVVAAVGQPAAPHAKTAPLPSFTKAAATPPAAAPSKPAKAPKKAKA